MRLFKTKQKPTTPTSTDHQLWRITLVIGVGDDSTYNHSGLACLLDAISTHTSILIVASDEDKLIMMSEASWDAVTKPITADDDKPKRVGREAVKAKRRWTKTDLAFIKKKHAEGFTINAIADAVGRTPTAVLKQLQRNKGN